MHHIWAALLFLGAVIAYGIITTLSNWKAGVEILEIILFIALNYVSAPKTDGGICGERRHSSARL